MYKLNYSDVQNRRIVMQIELLCTSSRLEKDRMLGPTTDKYIVQSSVGKRRQVTRTGVK